jgi:hypothetical protein
MNNNSIVLKAFNKQFFDFVNDVVNIFPNNDHLIKSREYFESIKKLNPTVIIKVWHKYICLPYHKKIEEGDLDFFFEKDYSEDLKYMQNSEEIINVINSTFREPLLNMNDTNRAHCKNHFQVISKLCNKYFE